MNIRLNFPLKTLCCALFLVLFFSETHAQIEVEKKKSDFWQHVRIGGGIGLSFGNGFFSGTLAPSAIYEFNNRFALGIGLNGTYNSLKDNYTSTILGGSIISLFNVIPEIQLSAELERLNANRKYDSSINFLVPPETNFWYTGLFLGVGYRTSNVTAGIRYDVLYKENESFYASAWAPFVRVYF